MKKRVLASILAGVLTVGVLTGCGSKTEEAADTTATEETTEDAAEDTAADAEETDAAATETKGTITVAALQHRTQRSWQQQNRSWLSRDGILKLPSSMIMYFRMRL